MMQPHDWLLRQNQSPFHLERHKEKTLLGDLPLCTRVIRFPVVFFLFYSLLGGIEKGHGMVLEYSSLVPFWGE